MNETKNCLKPVFDTCVTWTNESMPFFGIIYGQKYDVAVHSIATILQQYIEKEVNLKCLYDGTCDNCSQLVQIPEAVQILINKLCSLNSDQIDNVADLHCLGIGTISPDAAKLLNRPIRYSVSPNTDGAAITYDYSDTLKNLPAGFEIGQVQTRVSGTMKNGSSIISDSDKEYFISNVKSDRFPLNVSFEATIITPSGNVRLTRGVTISGTEAKEQTSIMDIHDFTTIDSKKYTQTQVDELITAALCEMRSELDQFKNLGISGLSCISIASGDIKDVVAALVGAVEALCARIEDLEDKVNTEPPCTGDC